MRAIINYENCDEQRFTLLGTMNAKVFPRLGEIPNGLLEFLGRSVIALSLLLAGCSPAPRYKTLPANYWLQQITDRDAANRYHAAHALGEMGPAVGGAVPALIKALEDPHTTVRWEAVKALAKFGPAARDASAALQRCVHDPEPSVRIAAQLALKVIGGESVSK